MIQYDFAFSPAIQRNGSFIFLLLHLECFFSIKIYYNSTMGKNRQRGRQGGMKHRNPNGDSSNSDSSIPSNANADSNADGNANANSNDAFDGATPC
jgi:hypothetical protein